MALLEAAKNSYPAIQSKDIRCESSPGLCKTHCRFKREERTTCANKWLTYQKERGEYQVLMSFPGIGEINSCSHYWRTR